MDLSESIIFTIVGFLLAMLIVILFFLFRKRKKIAIVISSILVIGYAAYYIYYPTYKAQQHEKKYEQVHTYLKEEYPNRKFTIQSKQYESGMVVGEFYVNDVETPEVGATLYVGLGGLITQTSSCTTGEHYPQQDVWKTVRFYHGDPYTLDKQIPEIKKVDEWIEDELTAFALTINSDPAIALFHYDNTSYSLIEVKEANANSFVVLEQKGYRFIYVDKAYSKETITYESKNGEDITIDVQQQKGKLIVEKMNDI